MKPERSLHYNVTPHWSHMQAAYALNAGVRTRYEGWAIVARGRACGSDIGLKCKVSLHLVCLLFTFIFSDVHMAVGELWVSTAKGRGHVRLGGRTNVTLKAGSFF